MQDISSAWKIAVATVVMSVIISMVLSLLYVSRAFWTRTETTVSTAVGDSVEAEAYQLASYGKPVPMAAIWKTMNSLTGSTKKEVRSVKSFAMYGSDGSLIPGVGYLDMQEHFHEKAYLSYVEDAGTYAIEVTLAS